MSEDLEDRLRSTLRRVDPDPGFAERVMSRIENEPRRSAFTRLRWPAALVASALVGTVAVHQWQAQREREGLEARKQLIEALRVTGEKLDLAYRVVNGESQPRPAPEPPA